MRCGVVGGNSAAAASGTVLAAVGYEGVNSTRQFRSVGLPFCNPLRGHERFEVALFAFREGFFLQSVDMDKHRPLLLRRQAANFGNDLDGCHAVMLRKPGRELPEV